MPFDKPPSPRAGLVMRSGGRKRWRFERKSALLQVAIIACISAILIGCAAPGEPTARHPIVPEAIKDLSARQQGNGAVLTFTLPTESTDKKPLGGPPAVEIYRSAPASNGASVNNPKPAMRLVDTIPADLVDSYKKDSHVEFRDELDAAELARQPGQQVTYTVRTRVSGERVSADSNPVKLPVYPAPQPVSELHANLTEKSIDLTWAPPESAVSATTPGATAGYRVYRAEIDPGSAAAAAEDSSNAVVRGALSPVALVHTPAYQDTDFAVGHSYLYLVRAVAQFGPDTVESTDSNDAVVTAMDVFPPAAPQGLVAVIVPATPGVPTYVELSWSIGPEADLAGYEVYRSEKPDTQGERVNGELLSAPTFRDVNVTAGQQYFYHVRAVDHAGNESPFSAGTEVDLAGR
jgi:hypothetical protein